MNVPKLRFKEFTDEWEEKKFKDIFKINQGLQIAINERFLEPAENRMFYITNEFLKENSKIKYYIENPPKNVICNEDDILMTRTGNTGEVVTDISGAFHNNFFKIAYDKNIFDKRFICYILKSSKIQNMILKLAGSSTIPDLNHSDFYKIKSIFPNLKEQKKIGDFLSSIDNKISITEEKLNLFKDYKKGLMKKIFNQELRFKDNNGNDYPKWEEKKLGEVSDIIMGQSPSSSTYNEEFKGLPLVQGNADCKNRKVYPRMYTTEITKESFPNDIIMTVRAPVGAISFSDIHSCIGRGVCAIRKANKFIYHYLIKLENSWDKLAQGSTFTAVNSNDIKNLVLTFPCLEEQQKIADFLSSIDTKIEKISDELENLKEFKKGLLQKMFV